MFLRIAIVALTLATAYIHLGLGGALFTLNGAGYVGLATLFVIAATVGHPLVRRFAWAAPVALAGYAATTIAGYLVIGPYFTLGWIAKGIEVTLIGFIASDVLRTYGSPLNLIRTAVRSVGLERRFS